jgi:hypothetical protein
VEEEVRDDYVLVSALVALGLAVGLGFVSLSGNIVPAAYAACLCFWWACRGLYIFFERK